MCEIEHAAAFFFRARKKNVSVWCENSSVFFKFFFSTVSLQISSRKMSALSLRPLNRLYIFSLKSSSSSASSCSTRCGKNAKTTTSSRFFSSFRSSSPLLWGTRTTRTISSSGRFEIGKATKSASSFYSSSSSSENNNNNNYYYGGERE